MLTLVYCIQVSVHLTTIAKECLYTSTTFIIKDYKFHCIFIKILRLKC